MSQTFEAWHLGSDVAVGRPGRRRSGLGLGRLQRLCDEDQRCTKGAPSTQGGGRKREGRKWESEGSLLLWEKGSLNFGLEILNMLYSQHDKTIQNSNTFGIVHGITHPLTGKSYSVVHFVSGWISYILIDTMDTPPFFEDLHWTSPSNWKNSIKKTIPFLKQLAIATSWSDHFKLTKKPNLKAPFSTRSFPLLIDQIWHQDGLTVF